METLRSRPSCEGRGLKHSWHTLLLFLIASPLMRGAWIETRTSKCRSPRMRSPLMRGAWIETPWATPGTCESRRRPSCEGRGLKRLCTGRNQGLSGRPSCEGRGLKQLASSSSTTLAPSPLMRGAWIETPARRRACARPPSPLMRGAWIKTCLQSCVHVSSGVVAPHARGVD